MRRSPRRTKINAPDKHWRSVQGARCRLDSGEREGAGREESAERASAGGDAVCDEDAVGDAVVIERKDPTGDAHADGATNY